VNLEQLTGNEVRNGLEAAIDATMHRFQTGRHRALAVALPASDPSTAGCGVTTDRGNDHHWNFRIDRCNRPTLRKRGQDADETEARAATADRSNDLIRPELSDWNEI
jgi:hypothetical protein